MHIPEYIILFSFVILIATLILLKIFHVPRARYLKILLITNVIIWFCVTFFGEIVYFWAGNATCSPYLGCVAGFFGYDAFEHLFFGIAGTLGIFWFCEHFPKYSLFHTNKFRNFLVIISIVAFVSVLWEIAECAHDALRVDILHEPLRNISLHINLLDQPTNLDTMGDLVFSLLGSVIGFFF